MMTPNKVFDRLFGLIADYHSHQNEGPFLNHQSPEELAKLLHLSEHEGECDWQHTFAIIEKYLRYSVKTNNPGFVNRMWCGANLPSIVGEFVAVASNTSACTYESAPVATLMEKYMIQKMLDLVGYTNGEGQMTTGSSNANMIAMLAARNKILQDVKRKDSLGSQNCSPLLVARRTTLLTRLLIFLA